MKTNVFVVVVFVPCGSSVHSVPFKYMMSHRRLMMLNVQFSSV